MLLPGPRSGIRTRPRLSRFFGPGACRSDKKRPFWTGKEGAGSPGVTGCPVSNWKPERGAMMEEEYFFECPWCGEAVSMILDLSVSHQSYIEDCEVCCRPIEIDYRSGGGDVEEFHARRG